MPKFEVGEIAIFIGIDHLTDNADKDLLRLNGSEVEILGYGGRYHGLYDAITVSGTDLCPYESELRKIPPKEDARKWFDENIKINSIAGVEYLHEISRKVLKAEA